MSSVTLIKQLPSKTPYILSRREIVTEHFILHPSVTLKVSHLVWVAHTHTHTVRVQTQHPDAFIKAEVTYVISHLTGFTQLVEENTLQHLKCCVQTLKGLKLPQLYHQLTDEIMLFFCHWAWLQPPQTQCAAVDTGKWKQQQHWLWQNGWMHHRLHWPVGWRWDDN